MRIFATRSQIPLRTAAFAAICLVMQPFATPARAQTTVDQVLNAVVRVQSKIDPEARTVRSLGGERDGHGVVIDSSGLVLTIGYLILEARSVQVTGSDGVARPARVVAYDHNTGFGLVRTLRPVDIRPMRLGDSSKLTVDSGVIVAGHGGVANSIRATVVSRRDFAGYWEYLLGDAIFTQPPFPVFGGAALIDKNGRLVGIGSLVVGDAKQEQTMSPGNMFVPINALKPILGALIANGRSDGDRHPWIGVYSEEFRRRVFVTRLASGGPGATGGVRVGDIIVAVGGKPVAGIKEFYRALWKLGAPGVAVPLTVLRQEGGLDTLSLRSRDRYDWLRLNKGE